MADGVMTGVDPFAYMQQIALRMKSVTSRDEIETLLDEAEYLFEVIPPDLQDGAVKTVIEQAERLLGEMAPNT